MILEALRSRLISNGYQPEDVDYSIQEILLYKKPESLNLTDFKIISVILKTKNSAFRQNEPATKIPANLYKMKM
ncbi:MAG TPA: hypothetical protein PK728_00145 [Bacillota bacterium]|nr:hypothetical protein [Bacillota bacterium]